MIGVTVSAYICTNLYALFFKAPVFSLSIFAELEWTPSCVTRIRISILEYFVSVLGGRSRELRHHDFEKKNIIEKIIKNAPANKKMNCFNQAL